MRAAVTVREGLVYVMDHDSELANRLSFEEGERARRVARAHAVRLSVGHWSPASAGELDALGLLVLDGVLVRYARLAGRQGAELLGAGDLLRPWDAHQETMACEEAWHVVAPVRFAILGSAFQRAVAPWPGITAELLCRAILRSRATVWQRAVSQHPSLEFRILALLWSLADRWGRVQPGGVLLPLPLSQSLLADLICASRQSVNRALGELRHRGDVEVLPRGLLLRRNPLEAPDVLVATEAARA